MVFLLIVKSNVGGTVHTFDNYLEKSGKGRILEKDICAVEFENILPLTLKIDPYSLMESDRSDSLQGNDIGQSFGTETSNVRLLL